MNLERKRFKILMKLEKTMVKQMSNTENHRVQEIQVKQLQNY